MYCIVRTRSPKIRATPGRARPQKIELAQDFQTRPRLSDSPVDLAPEKDKVVFLLRILILQPIMALFTNINITTVYW